MSLLETSSLYSLSSRFESQTALPLAMLNVPRGDHTTRIWRYSLQGPGAQGMSLLETSSLYSLSSRFESQTALPLAMLNVPHDHTTQSGLATKRVCGVHTSFIHSTNHALLQ